MADSVNQDALIIALASAPGRGGISVLRASGAGCDELICQLANATLPKPRYATRQQFVDASKDIIDDGLTLFFPAPHSYTGEDVAEFHVHGSPMVVQRFMARAGELGARLARPGEFTERAFLNNKMDLTQAEAVADLIDSRTQLAAKSALNSLQGAFANRIDELAQRILQLRVYVEAAIDFPDEEIDFLSDGVVQNHVDALHQALDTTLALSQRGQRLREGLSVVISGPPNAGKSSLLNALSDSDRAIVSDIPGTTRDIVEQGIEIDGLAIDLIDTAGIRDSDDVIEAEGIRRAIAARERADLVLLVLDHSDDPATNAAIIATHQSAQSAQSDATNAPMLLVINNKIDLTENPPGLHQEQLYVSVTQQLGLEQLREQIKTLAGLHDQSETTFIARQRHIDALQLARQHVNAGYHQLCEYAAGELLAEELKLAHDALGSITGKTTSDALLGEIFSAFCIGK